VSGRPAPAPADDAAAPPPVTVVLDDPTGALVLVAALAGAPQVHAWNDSAQAARAVRLAVGHLPAHAWEAVVLHETRADALAAAFQCAAGAEAAPADGGMEEAAGSPPSGVRILVEAPKQLAVVRNLLRDGAGTAAEVVVAGRDKHLSPRLNSVLGESFRQVHVSPGVRKSRLLIGVEPESTDAVEDDSLAVALAASSVPGVPDLSVTAWPGTFGGTTADAGAQLLVQAIADRWTASAAGVRSVLDLGCGNGWLLAALGVLFPAASLWGVDDVRAAVASTEVTVENSPGVRQDPQRSVVVVHADGTAPLPWAGPDGAVIEEGSFDLVTLNPPFHEGHTVTTETAHALIESAVRLLAPGGRLVLVHNSHLRYRSHLERVLSGVEQWARDRRFTVLTGTWGDRHVG
jgi:16S rRNA (guanine1207-N2)-methyltransferase